MVLVIDEEFRFSRNITVVYKNVFFSKKQIETVICGTSRPRQLVVWYSVVNERNKMSRTMHTRLVECINFIEKTHYCTRIAHYIFLQLITLLQCYCVHINWSFKNHSAAVVGKIMYGIWALSMLLLPLWHCCPPMRVVRYLISLGQ